MAGNKAVPVQVKKDSFHQQISHKQNNKENLSRFEANKKSTKLIQEELSKEKLTEVTIENGILLKYALPKSGKAVYDYLGHFQNGFVYFNHINLVSELKELIENNCEAMTV